MSTASILLVDDEHAIQRALTRVLRPDGYTLLTAASGAEALEVLAAKPVDVVLSDYRMPGMTGAQLLHEVASRYPGTGRLMLSGQADLHDVIVAMNNGTIDRFMTKPWSNDAVREVVREAVERAQNTSGDEAHYLGRPGRGALLDYLDGLQSNSARNWVVAAEIVNAVQSVAMLDREEAGILGELIAERIAESSRMSGVVCAIDHNILGFVLHSEDVQSDLSALVIAMRQPFRMRGGKVGVRFKFGVCGFDDPEDQGEDRVRKAVVALSALDASSANQISVYSKHLTANLHHKYTLEQDLHFALSKNEFFCEYQPQVDAQTFRIAAAESLVRWRHKQHGIVSPLHFIDLAERSGLIHELGLWVLNAGAEVLKQLQSVDLPMRISVNVSPRQFLEGDLSADVEQVLQSAWFPPDRLELEITESSVFQDFAAAQKMLERIRAMGVRIALDDFGTGYSSLAHLHQIPLDVLKFDRAFIRNLEEDPRSLTLFRHLAALARELHLEVVAEGVETLEQAEICREFGCSLLQGYYFHKPMPVDQLVSSLKEERHDHCH